jgi:hypothetical protein
MDILTLAAAKAAGKQAFSGQPGALLTKLGIGRESAALQVLGDSTGNEPTEWVYLLAQWLGTQYPRYAVRHRLWNDSTQTYDAPTVVSAGTDIPPPTVADTYDRADGQVTTDSLTSSGAAYLIVGGGTLSVTSNKLVPSQSGAYFLIAAPRADYTMTVDHTFVTGTNPRFFIRHADDANHLFVEIGLSSMTLYKRQGGTLTSLGAASSLGITNGQVKTVTITTSAQTVTITVNGVTLTYSLSTVEQQVFRSPTTVGFYANGTVAGTSIDSLNIVPGGLFLDIWNASMPGATASYSYTRFAQQLVVAAEMTITNYGHNQTYQDIRPELLALARGVLNYNPRTQLALTAQNPRAATNGKFTDGIVKNQAIASLAATEGYGLIDAGSAFLANPNYAADWLLSDGLHPNAAGSVVWSRAAQDFMRRTRTQPSTVQRPSRIFVPASAFTPTEGAPSLGLLADVIGMAFDPATQETAHTVVDIPSYWQSFNLTVIATTPANSGLTGSTNGIVWQIQIGNLGVDITATNAAPSTVVPAQAATQGTMAVNNAGAPSVYARQIVSRASVTGRPMPMRVRRLAADGADTYAQDASLIGVVIERAA